MLEHRQKKCKMKSLVSIFTYCPDTDRKLILLDLLKKIQNIRNDFDILVVSHSDLPDGIVDLCDFSFIESDNKLWYDFDFRNKFWFKTDIFNAYSSLIYPFSTHLSIYSLVHFTLNFAKYKGYKKVHCLEYDINIRDVNLIRNVDDKLNEFDNVMFRSDDGWVHGIYFAFTTEKLPDQYFTFDLSFIQNEILKVETRMTEHYTPKFLSVNDRQTYFEPVHSINETQTQLFDAHGNHELNWCVPLVEVEKDKLHIVVFNEKSENHKISIYYNDKGLVFDSGVHRSWKLIPLGSFTKIDNIKIYVDNKLKHDLTFDENNRNSFMENNFLKRI